MQETQVLSLVWEDPLGKTRKPTPVLLPENSIDRGAWQATVMGSQRVGLDWATFAHSHSDGWLQGQRLQDFLSTFYWTKCSSNLKYLDIMQSFFIDIMKGKVDCF